MNEILEQIQNQTSIFLQIELVNNLGVFKVSNTWGDLFIETHKTVSKANYKILMRMNKGVYMKVISFSAPATTENLLTLAKISIATNRYSQEALQSIKKNRLDRKYRTSSSSSREKRLAQWEHEIDCYGYSNINV